MKVLIYDGECNMCSMFVRFVVRMNKNPDLFITDFNSDWTARNVRIRRDTDSMMFISGLHQQLYSDAVIDLLSEIHWLFKPARILKFIPKVLRDKIYQVTAENRHRFFKTASCPLPSEKFRHMYLK